MTLWPIMAATPCAVGPKMPVYEIGLDDGRKLHIDADNKAAAAGALSGVVGLPGDFVALANLARRGYGALTDNGHTPQRDDYSLGENYANLRKAADNIYAEASPSPCKGAYRLRRVAAGGPQERSSVLLGQTGLKANER